MQTFLIQAFLLKMFINFLKILQTIFQNGKQHLKDSRQYYQQQQQQQQYSKHHFKIINILNISILNKYYQFGQLLVSVLKLIYINIIKNVYTSGQVKGSSWLCGMLTQYHKNTRSISITSYQYQYDALILLLQLLIINYQ